MAEHTDLAQRPDQATYRIRRASQEDYDAIAEVNRRAWTGGITTHELLERRHGPIDGRPWIEHIVDAMATHLAEPDVTTFVAEMEGRVVGYAAAQIGREEPSHDIGIVSYNAVHPDQQGQGIGTALIKQVTGYLEAQGARVLAVWTLEADEPVRRIYERMGFEELTRFVYYSRDCHGSTLTSSASLTHWPDDTHPDSREAGQAAIDRFAIHCEANSGSDYEEFHSSLGQDPKGFGKPLGSRGSGGITDDP